MNAGRRRQSTPLRELQSKRVRQEDTRIAHLFREVRKLWLRNTAPSLTLRQMAAVHRLLEKYVGKGVEETLAAAAAAPLARKGSSRR